MSLLYPLINMHQVLVGDLNIVPFIFQYCVKKPTLVAPGVHNNTLMRTYLQL